MSNSCHTNEPDSHGKSSIFWAQIFIYSRAAALLFILSACATKQVSPEETLVSIISDRAEVSDQEGTFQLSTKLYLKLQEINPDNLTYHTGYLRAVRQTKDRTSLLQYLNSNNKDPLAESPKFLPELIFTLLSFDLNDDALKLLERQPQGTLEKSTFYWLRGAININWGKLGLAESDYKECILGDPFKEECLFDYVQLLKKTNKEKELMEFIKKNNRYDLLKK